MRHRPTYRIVVMDSQRPRDGEYIESLGHYDPRTKNLLVNLERASYWQSVGAQATGTAGKLIQRFARAQNTPSAVEVIAELPEVVAEAEAVETAQEQAVDHTEDTTTSPPVTEESPEAVPDDSQDNTTA
jgi:small subunit ribosomal protein S16